MQRQVVRVVQQIAKARACCEGHELRVAQLAPAPAQPGFLHHRLPDIGPQRQAAGACCAALPHPRQKWRPTIAQSGQKTSGRQQIRQRRGCQHGPNPPRRRRCEAPDQRQQPQQHQLQQASPRARQPPHHANQRCRQQAQATPQALTTPATAVRSVAPGHSRHPDSAQRCKLVALPQIRVHRSRARLVHPGREVSRQFQVLQKAHAGAEHRRHHPGAGPTDQERLHIRSRPQRERIQPGQGQNDSQRQGKASASRQGRRGGFVGKVHRARLSGRGGPPRTALKTNRAAEKPPAARW